jgi:hypothetical protein
MAENQTIYLDAFSLSLLFRHLSAKRQKRGFTYQFPRPRDTIVRHRQEDATVVCLTCEFSPVNHPTIIEARL